MSDVLERDPLLGAILSDKYKVTRLVGSGGFARVYEADQRPLARSVAIKVLLPEWRDNAACLDKLALEARATSRIDHGSVVRVLDFVVSDSLTYIAMELVRGQTMRCALDGDRIELARALGWCEEILAGLAAAHRAGVVHADLKPSNVLIETARGGRERIKLIDFGSSPAGIDTPADTVCGTPQYMAPELGLGLPASEATDIYAVGVILFELVTGRVPFRGTTADDTIAMHVSRDLPRPDGLGVPAQVFDVVERAMAKGPDDRYSTADEMRAAVARARRELEDAPTRRFARATPCTAERAPTAPFVQPSESTIDDTCAVGLTGLSRAIGRAIRSGRVCDLPRLYERRAELLHRNGHVDQAIAELEEALCVITGGAGADACDTPRDLWRVLRLLARLYEVTGALQRARSSADSALRHATVSRSVDRARRTTRVWVREPGVGVDGGIPDGSADR